MVFRLACGDVMPGCSARFESTDRDELLGQVAAHASSAHGISDLTPDIQRLVEGHISLAS